MVPSDLTRLEDRVRAALRDRGERMTEPRRAVLAALATHPGHATAEQIVDAVAHLAPRVHRASVYRSLDALVDLGVVQHVHLGKGATTYHLVVASGPHLHAQCTGCGAVVDLPISLLDDVHARLLAEHGFRLDPGHVALAGSCADCAEPSDWEPASGGQALTPGD